LRNDHEKCVAARGGSYKHVLREMDTSSIGNSPIDIPGIPTRRGRWKMTMEKSESKDNQQSFFARNGEGWK
jgi:hypothetical protein